MPFLANHRCRALLLLALAKLWLAVGCVTDDASKNDAMVALSTQLGGGEFRVVGRPDDPPLSMSHGQVEMTIGSHYHGWSLGLVGSAESFAPRIEDSTRESLAWRGDTLVAYTTGGMLKYTSASIETFVTYQSGSLFLPSRIGETDYNGYVRPNGTRGRYDLRMATGGVHIFLVRWDGGGIGLGTLAARFWLTNGGACAGYDQDCGEDLGERGRERFEGQAFFMGFQMTSRIIDAIMTTFKTPGT